MWVKFRTKWSSGPSSWDYEFIPDGKMTLKAYIEEKESVSDSEWCWSDHYRGLDIDQVDAPPEEVLSEKISETKMLIKYYERHLADLQEFSNRLSNRND